MIRRKPPVMGGFEYMESSRRSTKTSSDARKKRDISRKLFISSWFLGALVLLLDLFKKDVSVDGTLIPTVSGPAYDFLVYFIGIFTANYSVRRGTDAYTQIKGVFSNNDTLPETTLPDDFTNQRGR